MDVLLEEQESFAVGFCGRGRRLRGDGGGGDDKEDAGEDAGRVQWPLHWTAGEAPAKEEGYGVHKVWSGGVGGGLTFGSKVEDPRDLSSKGIGVQSPPTKRMISPPLLLSDKI